jgi:hypothetical protein
VKVVFAPASAYKARELELAPGAQWDEVKTAISWAYGTNRSMFRLVDFVTADHRPPSEVIPAGRHVVVVVPS